MDKMMLMTRSAYFLRKIVNTDSRRTFSSTCNNKNSWRRAPASMVENEEFRVFMVCGEVSGDIIGGRLISSLKRLSPCPLRFAGVGGSMMNNEGLRSLFPMEDLAVMGIWELLPHLNNFRKRLLETTEAAFLFQPHVVVTVDSKGFSFRFLKLLRARYNQQGLSCPLRFHYVAPSFWAWKGGEERMNGLAKLVDHVLCILPFEVDICRAHGLAATFVGHPVVEDALSAQLGTSSQVDELVVLGKADNFRNEHGISSETTIISLLPGSRLQEVTRMLPIFADTLKLLRCSFPDMVAVIPVASNQHVQEHIKKNVQQWVVPAILISGESSFKKYDAFSASKAAIATSGTAVMELQLARLPCVVGYRAHFLTEWFIRLRTKSKYVSLPNILLDSAVIPEALLSNCTADRLSMLLNKIIWDESLREEQMASARNVLNILCPKQKSLYNLHGGRLGSSCTPSMIAASTIMYELTCNT
ncbi:hypothetical protein AMTRI_Chr10g4100 [Amborella trichopoda]|uniref:lipid-A-disaccharide synthase n=1 Tax=Amborella trichopoda TaxID=13333 RepID=W1NQ99_AMBTC|nr:probable lipid-A-disaccharide synthase, mitochondrial [Amborella trichopoda]XP_020517459.1 probable lipid-A-disaccharide synthase, mitochondrial [Amborella trichopoda]ERM96959.1 hypothetical protein AMTR_s00074p00162130 [Amborella trichopoda]|eukprot:XP_006829543.3 probable lipid-A-disaccharide synthase, mitochondrial [Amborella trichopoda]